MAGSPFRIAGSELRRFRGVLPVIALVFIVLVPLIYGAIYVTANWDPYKRLSNLPVAIVNDDQPAKANGQTVTAGDDLTNNLIDQHHFDWYTTDADTAQQGLDDGDYYLTLTIPSDFSKNLASAKSFDPSRADIKLRRNDANGFVIGSVTSSSQNRIEQTVNKSVVKSYFDVVFSEMSRLKTGLTDASGNSKQLAAGTKTTHKSARKLDKGAAKVDKAAHRTHTGAKSLSSGLKTAHTGASDLSSGLQDLDDRSDDVSSGASDVASGTQQLSDRLTPTLNKLQRRVPKAGDRADRASHKMSRAARTASGSSSSVSHDLDRGNTALKQLANKHPGLANDPAYRKLTNRMDRASTRADKTGRIARRQSRSVGKINTKLGGEGQGLDESISEAKDDVTNLNDGAHDVSDGARRLNNGIARASSSADTLDSGVSKASTASKKLSKGSRKLSDGTSKMKTGNHDLSKALGTLSDGTADLHDQLASSAKKVPSVNAGKQSHAAEVLAAPAKVDTHVDNPATYYGRGLAPMFFAIAIWVFGITAFMVLRAVSSRSLAGRGNLAAVTLGNWLPVGGLAILGSLLMIGTSWLFLGLDPVRPLQFAGIAALGAVAFSAIAQLLRMLFGTAGSAIMLVWLILQLSSTGGTYPPPVLPQFFAAINPYMPMTYLIDAFRLTISGGTVDHLIRDAIVLGSITVVAFGLIALVAARKRRFRMGDLHPALAPP